MSTGMDHNYIALAHMSAVDLDVTEEIVTDANREKKEEATSLP